MRINERNIEIPRQTWKQITDKANEAKKMGVTESLIITNNAALIVGTKKIKSSQSWTGMKHQLKFLRTSMER
ncbi:hypothetical protein N9I19_01425 [Peribacillus sp. CSMR9]|jgi:hypothetical protein|nr:hypothetical protein [Peribacillus sp. CSMR9]